MRVNIYAEEMTDRVEIISKKIDGHEFTGCRFYLELPATVGGKQHQGPFLHRPGDDDSAAVTFWGKRDLRAVLGRAIGLLDDHYGKRSGKTKRTAASVAQKAAAFEWLRNEALSKKSHARAAAVMLQEVHDLNQRAAAGIPALKPSEIYAGLTLHQGQPCHLVLLPGGKDLNHAAAIAWADKLGGELPSRVDALLLWENEKTRKAIGACWMWTSQTYAHYGAYAWVQSFFNGYQDDDLKGFDYRARAVRRVPI